jgi:diadenosine tetraphosphate (Ap4A) HIT family hydrolase
MAESTRSRHQRTVALDVDAYARQVRADAREGRCFICSIVAGERDDHAIVDRDDLSVAFLSRFPTLLGYCLLAPIEHRTNVVTDFSEDEYVELQRRVHRLGAALATVVPTERLYVLSLGSHQGNSHVHWHVAPLPPGVPYDEQQYAALMHEDGYLDIPFDDQRALAHRIADQLTRGSATTALPIGLGQPAEDVVVVGERGLPSLEVAGELVRPGDDIGDLEADALDVGL